MFDCRLGYLIWSLVFQSSTIPFPFTNLSKDAVKPFIYIIVYHILSREENTR